VPPCRIPSSAISADLTAALEDWMTARAIEHAPGRNHGRTVHVALEIGLQPGLTERFLGGTRIPVQA